MRVGKIDTTPFEGVKIIAKDNKEVKFLYNKVVDVVKENKIPAVFATDYIQLPTTTEKILKRLTELNVSYKETK